MKPINNATLDKKFNINVFGGGEQPMLFAHGYGCDQHMFRFLYPYFEKDYKIILFDYIGAGESDSSSYSPTKYNSLDAYADDIIEICEHLDLQNIIFVGHSVSSMIGVLASNKNPSLFSKLILIGPSPRYINDTDYIGGFEESSIQELLETLDSNYLGWSTTMAPVIMGNSNRPQLGEELATSFCSTDPEIAKNFARVTFLSDNREDLKSVAIPSLVLQCEKDIIAPIEVGKYTAEALPNGFLKILNATGHCPHLSAPEATAKAITAFIS